MLRQPCKPVGPAQHRTPDYMFSSLRTAAAKLTRGDSGGATSQSQKSSDKDDEEGGDVVSAEKPDTLGSIHSVPPRSSVSRDRGRQSLDNRSKGSPSSMSTCGSSSKVSASSLPCFSAKVAAF